MPKLMIFATISGVCFGAWPLLMRWSGLSGNISSLVLLVGSTCMTIAFIAIFGSFTIQGSPDHRYAIVSVLIGAIGMLLFTNMFAQSPPADVGRLIVITTLVQVMIPIMYQMFIIGDQSIRRISGVLCALVAIALLS